MEYFQSSRRDAQTFIEVPWKLECHPHLTPFRCPTLGQETNADAHCGGVHILYVDSIY